MTSNSFRPAIPGTPGYIAQWSKILNSGLIPKKSKFNVTEVIHLTAYCDAETGDLSRFLLYRLFTLSVAVQLYFVVNDSESILPANYTAFRLVDDSHRLGDPEIDNVVGNVLPETAEGLKTRPRIEYEYAFFYAAEMLWAQRHNDFARADACAITLLEEDDRVRHRDDYYGDDGPFLFGLTVFDQLNSEWREAIAELTNPNQSEHTQLVIESLR